MILLLVVLYIDISGTIRGMQHHLFPILSDIIVLVSSNYDICFYKNGIVPSENKTINFALYQSFYPEFYLNLNFKLVLIILNVWLLL